MSGISEISKNETKEKEEKTWWCPICGDTQRVKYGTTCTQEDYWNCENSNKAHLTGRVYLEDTNG